MGRVIILTEDTKAALSGGWEHHLGSNKGMAEGRPHYVCGQKPQRDGGRGPDGEPLYTHGGLLRVDFKAKALLCPEAWLRGTPGHILFLFTCGAYREMLMRYCRFQ